MAPDLKALSVINALFKFADDTTLLAPGKKQHRLTNRVQHIRCWAEDNMSINL